MSDKFNTTTLLSLERLIKNDVLFLFRLLVSLRTELPTLSAGHLHVLTTLAAISPEGIRSAQLCDLLGIKQANITKIIKKFDDVGLIERDVDPDNASATLVKASNKLMLIFTHCVSKADTATQKPVELNYNFLLQTNQKSTLPEIDSLNDNQINAVKEFIENMKSGRS